VRDGELVWAGSSGRARDGRTELMPGTPLVIGSVTKTFVAAVVLQLAAEGRIDLDDRVRTYLPELDVPGGQVTIAQLLDHTSGLADVFNDTTRAGLETDPSHAWTAPELLGRSTSRGTRQGSGGPTPTPTTTCSGSSWSALRETPLTTSSSAAC
jgi:D-alanyl-D-alanine carboxypeptidase